MASRKSTRAAALSCQYQLRRCKKSALIEESGYAEVQEESSKKEPQARKNSDISTASAQNQGKKRKLVTADFEKKEDGDCKSDSHSIVSKSSSSDQWFPPNWEKVLDNIRHMRKETEAPVDTMGCDMCHDTTMSPQIQRYQILVSLMLSSQTKDQVTFAAMGRLRQHGLTPESMIKINDKVLEDLLKPVGFYKRKTEYIKRASQILLDKYGGDIPNSVDKLCELPGVGPKMAHICMNSAWGVVSGIGVDTHVHRISQRIGWLPPKVKAKKHLTPEVTRVALESWLPQPLWSEVNHLLVGFGQTICKPVSPSCKSCLNFSICPSAKLKW